LHSFYPLAKFHMRSEVTDVGVAYLSRHIDVRRELNSSAAGTKH